MANLTSNHPSSNALAIFVLFFGSALLSAFMQQDWAVVTFWVVMGLVFLRIERRGQRTKSQT